MNTPSPDALQVEAVGGAEASCLPSTYAQLSAAVNLNQLTLRIPH